MKLFRLQTCPADRESNPLTISGGKKTSAPGEARTHNPGISQCTVYKYRALTDCATGAW